jgi:cell division protein FtsW (lipid II flippase)
VPAASALSGGDALLRSARAWRWSGRRRCSSSWSSIYRRLQDFAFVFYLGTSGLLVGVLLKGSTVNGAEAWFNVGPFQLQPSEFARSPWC